MSITKKQDTRNPLNYLNYPKLSIKTKVIDSEKLLKPKKEESKNSVFVHLLISPEKEDSTSTHKTNKKIKETTSSAASKPLLTHYPFFQAKPKELLQTHFEWYYGLGSFDKINLDSLSDIFRELMQKVIANLEEVIISLPSKLLEKIEISHLANICATSLGISSYSADLLKSKPVSIKIKIKEVSFALPKKYHSDFNKHLNKYLLLIDHINGTRQMQSLPGNYLTPQTAEVRAKKMAKQFGLKIKVLNKSALQKIGAGGILAVSQGSHREPRLIVLEYKPKSNKKCPTLAIVGKGVTFDTGGISIKPGGDMHEMKYDMSGSAVALHAVAAISKLKLPIHAVAIVGMVENMPGGNAFKPGDVYTSLKGLTIEVQNTDAEGRLVLGDLLYYAEKNYKPNLMINLATLTGAILVALGPFYAGCFSRHEKVTQLIKESSEKSLEPVWSLPLSNRYKDLLKSNIADYNNIGGRYGGSSSAASFLSLFVEENTNWAHLDIAGIGFIKSPFQLYPSVATGYGIRLLTEISENLIKSPDSL